MREMRIWLLALLLLGSTARSSDPREAEPHAAEPPEEEAPLEEGTEEPEAPDETPKPDKPAEKPHAPAPQDFQSLIAGLGAEDTKGRERSAYQLKMAGSAAIEPLRQASLVESPVGRAAGDLLAFVKGPGGEWGGWLRRLASAGEPEKSKGTLRGSFAKLGGKAVPFLQEAARLDADGAIRTAATELLEKHCRFAIGLSTRVTIEKDGVYLLAGGKTDLPDDAAVSVWIYAQLDEPGAAPPSKDATEKPAEPRRRYVDGDSTRVKDGLYSVRLGPWALAPGRYEATAQAEPVGPGSPLAGILLLRAGTDAERWVGGVEEISAKGVFEFGTKEEIARERESGQVRARANLERLGALYAQLASRAVWTGAGREIAQELPPRAVELGKLLESPDPAERSKGREALAKEGPAFEPALWAELGARKGTSDAKPWAEAAAVLHRDWERRVASVRDALAFESWRQPGRDEQVYKSLSLYPGASRRGVELAEGLLPVGRAVLGAALPEPAFAEKPLYPAEEGRAIPARQDAWLAAYGEAMRAYAEDRLASHLTRFERIQREADDRLAELRAEPPGEARAKAWKARAEGWERDLAAISAEWQGEAKVGADATAFAKRAAACLAERLGDFDGVVEAARGSIAARAKALETGDAKPASESAAAFRERLNACREAIRQGVVTIGAVRVFTKTGEIEVDGKVSLQEGLAELVACTPDGKAYESMFVVPARPSDLYYALLRLGVRPGLAPNMTGAERRPRGDLVDVWVEWREEGGWRKARAEEMVVNLTTGKPVDRRGWVFVGSEFAVEKDAATGLSHEYFLANATGSLITASAGYNTSSVLDSALRLAYGETVANPKTVPKPGSEIRLRIRPIPAAEAKPIYEQMEKDLQEMERQRKEWEKEREKLEQEQRQERERKPEKGGTR